MNIVVRELNKKKTLQEFLLALLDDVEKYFKSAPPLSEEKAHASLTTIFTRVARDFPLISSVSNIAKRLSKDLRDKISDRCEKSNKERKKGTGLKSFMEGIQASNNKPIQQTQESQEILNNWVKKMLLEGISELKEDIREAEPAAATNLIAKLQKTTVVGQQPPSILFIDSFLINETVVSQIKDFNIRRVVVDQRELKADQISIINAAQHLRKARLLLISADAVLRNGGIIARNGALMLAVAAHQLNIPVLGITRSYCLWEHIMVNQSSLILSESGKSQFPHEDESSFRVLISKKYDYLEPKLVNSLVSQSRGWESQTIVEIFEEYYH